MLKLEIPAAEDEWNEETEEFVSRRGYTFNVEHSLISISKWESKWHVPFLSTQKTYEQTIDYIRCMTLTPGIPDEVYLQLPDSEVDRVNAYIGDPYSATTFNEDVLKENEGKGAFRQDSTVTSELIYYWMFGQQIPKECEQWHINRLINLLRIFEIKSRKPKKMSRAEIMARNAALNKQRRAKYHTKG